MLSFNNSRNGEWAEGTAEYPEGYRIYPNVTMRFKNIKEGTDYSDKYHYFNEAYKTTQVFFGSPEDTFRQFMTYYPDITKLMMFDSYAFNLYKESSVWFDVPEFDEKVNSVEKLDVKACAEMEDDPDITPVIRFLNIHPISGQYYYQASSQNYKLGPNSVKKFMNDVHPVNYAHKFVIERTRLRFICYLGLSNEEIPKMLFAELFVDLCWNNYDRNFSDVTSLVLTANSLYGGVLGKGWRSVQDIVDKILQNANLGK